MRCIFKTRTQSFPKPNKNFWCLNLFKGIKVGPGWEPYALTAVLCCKDKGWHRTTICVCYFDSQLKCVIIFNWALLYPLSSSSFWNKRFPPFLSASFFLVGCPPQTEGLNSRWLGFLFSQPELCAWDVHISDVCCQWHCTLSGTEHSLQSELLAHGDLFVHNLALLFETVGNNLLLFCVSVCVILNKAYSADQSYMILLHVDVSKDFQLQQFIHRDLMCNLVLFLAIYITPLKSLQLFFCEVASPFVHISLCLGLPLLFHTSISSSLLIFPLLSPISVYISFPHSMTFFPLFNIVLLLHTVPHLPFPPFASFLRCPSLRSLHPCATQCPSVFLLIFSDFLYILNLPKCTFLNDKQQISNKLMHTHACIDTHAHTEEWQPTLRVEERTVGDSHFITVRYRQKHTYSHTENWLWSSCISSGVMSRHLLLWCLPVCQDVVCSKDELLCMQWGMCYLPHQESRVYFLFFFLVSF